MLRPANVSKGIRSKPKTTWVRHGEYLDFEMSTNAYRLNPMNMNYYLARNSRENALKGACSMILHVRRRLPHPGVVRWEVV